MSSGRLASRLSSRTHDLKRQNANCVLPDPANTITDRLNQLLNSSGPGYVLSLCPGSQYLIQAPILFHSPNQEISTVGYPNDSSRATLVVAGPVSNGTGHTTAIDGTCANCNGVKIRNIQIDGTRKGASPTMGGANIEMGGPNSGQLIEHVHSFDPRSWSCLHLAEGSLNCTGATVRNNDIGPCGSDAFQQWADGISVSCSNSLIEDNVINNPTDGGIVLFGAPGTLVQNNTIFINNMTLLGGINLVDYDPWSGNYTGTVVTHNTIYGGFAAGQPVPNEPKGINPEHAIIKIGIAIGPRTWFGNHYGNNVSASGTVLNNQLSGAFGYAIAMSSARNFTVEGNYLFGNTSFIGSRGPNCSSTDTTPSPAPFVLDQNNTQSSTTQPDFQVIPDGDSLTCVVPPNGGDYWPFQANATQSGVGSQSHSGLSSGAKAGIALGVVGGVALVALATYFIRRRAISRTYHAKRITDKVT